MRNLLDEAPQSGSLLSGGVSTRKAEAACVRSSTSVRDAFDIQAASRASGQILRSMAAMANVSRNIRTALVIKTDSTHGIQLLLSAWLPAPQDDQDLRVRIALDPKAAQHPAPLDDVDIGTQHQPPIEAHQTVTRRAMPSASSPLSGKMTEVSDEVVQGRRIMVLTDTEQPTGYGECQGCIPSASPRRCCGVSEGSSALQPETLPELPWNLVDSPQAVVAYSGCKDGMTADLALARKQWIGEAPADRLRHH